MKRIAGLLATLAVTGGCMTGGGMGNSGMGGGGQMALAGPHGTPLSMAAMGGGGMGMGGMPGMGMPGMGMPGMGMPGMGMGGISQAGYMSDGPNSGVLMAGANGFGHPPGAPPLPYGMGGYGQAGQVNAFNHMGGPGGPGGGGAAQVAVGRTQVRFVGPVGANVSWYVGTPGGQSVLAPQLDMPGRYNFAQAAIYRLKISNIRSNKHPGMELYPSIEVVPSNAKTDAFLAHNAVPVEFSDEDLDQISAGNMITKVIYLPDPQYQCAGGVAEELSSTKLDVGVDPIAEANRRGNILLVIRVGAIDLELKNSPGLNAPGLFGAPGGGPAGPTGPAAGSPGSAVPPGMLPPPSVGGPAGATSPQTQIQGPRGYNLNPAPYDQGSFSIRKNIVQK